MSKAVVFLVSLALATAGCVASAPDSVLERSERYTTVFDLPSPALTGSKSVEEALAARRSSRDFDAAGLSIAELSQLFWAAQGITDGAGHRTAPSAGARYPLEIYAVTATDIMHYLPTEHRVEVGQVDNPLEKLGGAAFGQDWIGSAPVVLVIAGVVSRTEFEYGALADELMNREAGHAAQNILLQATALDLVSVPVGGFDPAAMATLLAVGPDAEILYLLPVGRPG